MLVGLHRWVNLASRRFVVNVAAALNQDGVSLVIAVPGTSVCSDVLW